MISLINSFRFPEDLFKRSSTPLPLEYKDERIGVKIDDEIFLQLPAYVDEVMSTLIPIIKAKQPVFMADPNRPERYCIKLINGFTIYFACDYFTYKYLYIKYLMANQTTSDVDDVSTAVLGYKVLTGQMTPEQVKTHVESLWESI